MTDTEKINLIRKVITDFWEYNSDEQMERGAVAIVTTIYTIAEFENGRERKDNE